MKFSFFPVLPGSAKAQLICCGIIKCLLIAYIIRDISTKKISKSVHVCQTYSKPQVGRFLRHGVVKKPAAMCEEQLYERQRYSSQYVN